MKLQDAADYIKTSKASKAFYVILNTFKKIFTFSQERDNRLIRYVRIVREYKKKIEVDAIASKYGCSRSTVLRYARLAGLPKRPKHFPEEIKKAVLIDCKKKLPLKTISELHGVSISYISTLEKEAGISRRRKNV